MRSQRPTTRQPAPYEKSLLPRGPISGAIAARPRPPAQKQHQNRGGVFHQPAMQERQSD